MSLNVTLKPDAQQFVEQQIRAGHFRSAEEVLDEAVHRMMIESDEIDDETAAAINRAEEQIDRGEGIDFDEFAAKMRQRIAGK